MFVATLHCGIASSVARWLTVGKADAGTRNEPMLEITLNNRSENSRFQDMTGTRPS